MRILVQIHTWNDEEIVDEALRRILAQTYPVRDVLLVDNGSTDATLDRPFAPVVTVLRHERNLGTSGSVKAALEYAERNGFDWVWVLDGDSLPAPDALARLVELYESFPEQERAAIGILSSSHQLRDLGQTFHGRMLTPGGMRLPVIDESRIWLDCDAIIWSGALIRTATIHRAGLPRSFGKGCWEDLALDYGDVEFSFRVRQAGYRVLIHRSSMIDHPVGKGLEGKILGHTIHSTNHSAARRYLYFRNLIYFWLFLYPRRAWPSFLVWLAYRTGMIVTGIVLLEQDKRRKLRAVARGFADGLRRRLDRPFEPADA